MTKPWSWIWPRTGATPTKEDSESEMFDSDSYPYTETFVREAIQNSLDARLDDSKPVVVRFGFHQSKNPKAKSILKQAIEFRRMAKLRVPAEWANGDFVWVTVEDSNTKGLLGDLSYRKSDFWNYWLNFGKSNKSAGARGGRGIGRVTFLIASQISSVIALTRRSDDDVLAGCGMCVLKADEYDSEFLSTHCYLAQSEAGAIYDLHESEEFHRDLIDAFGLVDYLEDENATGLSLVVPFPHSELEPNGIMGSAVDHFAPAIADGTLVVEVDVNRLDDKSIVELAPMLGRDIRSQAIKEDTPRYISMVASGCEKSSCTIHLNSVKPGALNERRDADEAQKLRDQLQAGRRVTFSLEFPMRQNSQDTVVSIKVVAQEVPYGKRPLDRLFREGMSLPDVDSFRPGSLDVLLLVNDERLADYLNLCEGKAHLDLSESKEVRQKLEEAGFDGVAVKRFVKRLPNEIREFLTVESDQPDTSVFDAFFAIEDDASPRPGPKPKPKPTPPAPVPPPPPPPPNVSPVIVETLENGFRLEANNKYDGFPASVTVSVAYADGSKKPSWSPFDFKFESLVLEHEGCVVETVENRIRLTDFTSNSKLAVSGFDAKRELDVRIWSQRHAS